ncbi:MAG: CotH kinase family protein [Anaerolineales bacterium]|nr:CotH kinase family protein [Anaerolineales bacterium]
MLDYKTTATLLVIILFGLLLAGCNTTTATAVTETAVTNTSTTETTAANANITRPTGWTEATHSNDVDPNYDVVFPDDKVNRIDITVTAENWETMLANMTELFGEFGSGNGRGGPGGFAGGNAGAAGAVPPTGNNRPAAGNRPEVGDAPAAPDNRDVGAGRGMGGDFTTENPVFVLATIEFEGNTWTNVGVRFKGNSTLSTAWRNGTYKIPLKLDFDEFEEEYPEIDNQRFYGFKQLSLSNNVNDSTYMHDTIASDVLAAAGIPVAHTAYYEVYLDYGEGPVNLGLYTVIEVVDDTVIDAWFGNDDGNIYEADGNGATFAANSNAQISGSFEKENNEDEADWSDLQALYSALHAETRVTNPTAWRAELESVFDVDTFLNWLSINTLLQNWDTYGSIAHNFYLYNNPETGQLTWIPWDNNESFTSRGRGGQSEIVTSFDKSGTSDAWPLISYLLADEVYLAQYNAYLETALNDSFVPAVLAENVEEIEGLLAPYIAENNKAGWETAVTNLITLINTSHDQATAYLAAQ